MENDTTALPSEMPLDKLPAAGKTEATVFTSKVEQFIALAQQYQITCAEDADMCADDLARLKELLKNAEAKRKTVTDPLHQAKEAIMALFRPVTSVGEQAVEILEAKLIAWRKHVLAEQEKAEALARQVAAAAAAKARAEAEEAARRLQAERDQAEAARQAAMKAEAEAQAAALQGNLALAAEKAATVSTLRHAVDQAETVALAQQELVASKALEAAVVATPIYTGGPRKTKGAAYVPNYQFRVTKFEDIPREYLCVDEKKVGAIVKAMKQMTNIAGIEVYDAGSIRSTRSK